MATGTETTPDSEQATNLIVLNRDGRACLACGDEGGVFSVGGETTIKVVRRDPEWRHVVENLWTACDLHANLQGTADAVGDGRSHRVTTGDPVDQVPFLTRDGYRWLNHSGDLLTKRPKR